MNLPLALLRRWGARVDVTFRRLWTPIGARLTRRRLNVVMQLQPSDCGAACLTMILSHHGRTVGLSAINDVLASDRSGLSAYTLVETARRLGLRARGLRVRPDAVGSLATPAILHWDFKHFVVLERWTPQRSWIVDPAVGRRVVSSRELASGFTGIALVFAPDSSFQPMPRSEPLWRRYLNHALKAQRPSVARVLSASTLLQVLGLGLPLLTAFVVDRVIPRTSPTAFQVALLGMLVWVVTWTLAAAARSLLVTSLQTHLDRYLVLGFFTHLLALPYSFFQRRSAGDLVMRVESNVVIRDLLSNQVLSMGLDGFLVLIYLGVMLSYEPHLALLVVAAGALQLLIGGVGILLVQDRVQRDVLAQTKSQSYLVEVMRGIQTVKASGAEVPVLDRWTDLFEAQLAASMTRQRVAGTIQVAADAVRQATPLVLLAVGATLVISNRLTLGVLLGVIAIASGFLGPLSTLVRSIQSIALLRTQLERIDDVLRHPKETRLNAVVPPGGIRGAISVREVSFRYGVGGALVLRGIDLEVPAGARVAIVGRSGSGKSTLGCLLVGLHAPTAGVIELDGVDLSTIDRTVLRRSVSAVFQGATLFAGTIRSNLLLASPRASERALRDALAAAGLEQDVSRMPLGLDTAVTEAGGNLSGGQRQRLHIARAFLAHPRIVLLDEATSEVDPVTERAVSGAMANLHCTQVVIAHRLGAELNADLIAVLENGSLVECGTDTALRRRNGPYAQLLNAQRGSAEPA